MFKTKIKKDCLNVADFLNALKDCRPDAEVFVCLFTESDCNKIRAIENKGNFVQLVRELK